MKRSALDKFIDTCGDVLSTSFYSSEKSLLLRAGIEYTRADHNAYLESDTYKIWFSDFLKEDAEILSDLKDKAQNAIPQKAWGCSSSQDAEADQNLIKKLNDNFSVVAEMMKIQAPELTNLIYSLEHYKGTVHSKVTPVFS